MIEYGFAEAADYKLSGKDGKQEWMTPNPLPVSTGQKIVITKNIRKPDQYDVQNGQIEIVVDIWDVDADAYDKVQREHAVMSCCLLDPPSLGQSNRPGDAQRPPRRRWSDEKVGQGMH